MKIKTKLVLHIPWLKPNLFGNSTKSSILDSNKITPITTIAIATQNKIRKQQGLI